MPSRRSSKNAEPEQDTSAGGPADLEWFAKPDSPEGGKGLRFSCTMCGNCCTGPTGYVLVNDDECSDMARKLGMTMEAFLAEHTHMMPLGRSLNERKTKHGYDCVFLDRQKLPGKAVCGLYEARPRQCKTWPWWSSVIATRDDYDQAQKKCPGLGKGTLVPVSEIRIQRKIIEI